MNDSFRFFSQRVLEDPALLARLRQAGKDGSFFESAAALAREWSLPLSESDLRAADRNSRRKWTERFL